MRLVRSQHRADGIFGRLYNEHGVPLAWVLEHAYASPAGQAALAGGVTTALLGAAAGTVGATTYHPKLPLGQYKCVRGKHRLHGMDHDFETFEVTNVPQHTGILFHWGNKNSDSDGCLLLGNAIVTQGDGTEWVVNSKRSFEDFMSGLHDVKEFILTVELAKEKK